jgi:organic hydroperoxide reductase OsmC/OhrA
MRAYPMKFHVQAQATSGRDSLWTTHAEHFSQSLTMAIPPEFDGPGGGFSPEDIYALALQNCFVATFKVFAEKSNLAFENIRVEGVLDVDRDEKGRPWMARFHLHAHLDGVIQSENAKRILEKTAQSCMILNSVRTEKSFLFSINGEIFS